MNDSHKHGSTDKHSGQTEGLAAARDSAGSVYDRTVEKASQTLESSRDLAADAARRTAAGIETNPLAVLVGGLVLGAVVGALLPRSAKERELLAPLGARIGDKARGAIGAARQAGQSELDNAGLTRDNAREQVKSLFDGAFKALTAAGTAAANSSAGSVNPAR